MYWFYGSSPLKINSYFNLLYNLNNVTRIVTSGTRAYDIAIRIKTNGFSAEKIEPYLDLKEAVKSLYKTSTKKYVIANYTALQPTRHALKEHNTSKEI